MNKKGNTAWNVERVDTTSKKPTMIRKLENIMLIMLKKVIITKIFIIFKRVVACILGTNLYNIYYAYINTNNQENNTSPYSALIIGSVTNFAETPII